MKKAMQQAFPSAPRLTCTRHLRQNIEHDLQDNVGAPQKIRNAITETVFGTSGVANSDDIIVFDYRLKLNKKIYDDSAPAFHNYFQTRVVPL